MTFTSSPLLLLVIILCASVALADRWDKHDDPSIFSSSFSYSFGGMPTSGRLKQLPWSDTYWPSFQGGIAHRWFSRDPQDFSYKPYSKEDLLSMNEDELRGLSPAEKFDIYVGRYDYPTVNSEWKRTSPQDAKWEGLCHGWAPASLFYSQPNPVTLKNPDGISVPFGSSDVKALLTYFAAEYQDRSSKTPFLAERCQYDLKSSPEYENTSACSDINAGSFHVLLANQLGSMNEGFVIDRDRSIQVWNQPMAGYQSKVVGTTTPSRPGASSGVVVNTKISYAKETVPAWEAHDPYILTEDYSYTLEVDERGNIVGGAHQTWDRPDFAWKMQISDFHDYFSALKAIYQSSVNGAPNDRINAMNVREVPEDIIYLPEEPSCFGTPVGGYTNNERLSWSIEASEHNRGRSLVISFKSFATERFRDKVKIYEGSLGEGPLIAVLHGSSMPEEVYVRDSAAYVVFTSDTAGTDAGFVACYEWV